MPFDSTDSGGSIIWSSVLLEIKEREFPVVVVGAYEAVVPAYYVNRDMPLPWEDEQAVKIISMTVAEMVTAYAMQTRMEFLPHKYRDHPENFRNKYLIQVLSAIDGLIHRYYSHAVEAIGEEEVKAQARAQEMLTFKTDFLESQLAGLLARRHQQRWDVPANVPKEGGIVTPEGTFLPL